MVLLNIKCTFENINMCKNVQIMCILYKCVCVEYCLHKYCYLRIL